MTTPPRRRFLYGLLLLAAAGYGLAVFLAVLPRLAGSGPPGQLPSFLAAQGLDARGPFRAMAALLLLPGLAALAYRPAAARLAALGSAPWAAWMAAGSLGAALWARLAGSHHTATLVLTALAAVGLLGARRRPIAFTALDTLLIPAFVVVDFALLDLVPGIPFAEAVLLALLAVLCVRIGLGATDRPGRVPAAWCFSVAPAAHVFQIQVLQQGQAWPSVLAAVIALGSPFALRLLGWNERAARWVRAVLVYASLPLFAVAYSTSSTVSGSEGGFRVEMFEDGHQLAPASEMLRGERMYRDVVPAHGMISDGGLDWLVMRLFGARIGIALAVRYGVSCLNAVVVYALGLAATGSPVVGLLTVLFSAHVIPYGLPWLRTVPALAALVCMMSAARHRDPRRLAPAGALLVLALLTSLDMGMYSGAVLLLAVVRFGGWRERLRAVRWSLAGLVSAALPAAVCLAVRGTLGDLLRVTLFEVLPLGPVYALGLDWAPAALQSHAVLPDALLTVFDPSVFRFLLWAVVTLATAAGLAASPLRARWRTEPLWLLGSWVAVAGFSFAERHHDYFLFGLAPFLVIAAFLLWRARSAPAHTWGAVALAVLVAVSQPTIHLVVSSMLRTGQVPRGDVIEYTAVPRARGALFESLDVLRLEAARTFVRTALRPGETYFDFANKPILYFLFDLPCPIRQLEVPFYETEEAQREVIARLERDRSVRAALIAFGTPRKAAIDGVRNPERAPLVWAWLQQHFRPAYVQNGVVFWVRSDE
jgi:hypothetical protein